ncbi:MAG: galactokinase [Ignavibacteria bacterium CG_4_10_14_3_um_filter_37_18]|nr:MAG: galactokinase [Ignavibacteria bacterium CG_4_10_14_3_um_filter_37_18]
MNSISQIVKVYKNFFNDEPILVRSPGRLNFIGEHTDYNMGFVLPAAIDNAIYFAIAPRTDTRYKLISADLNEDYEFSLETLSKSKKGWANYLIGVVDQLIKAGYQLKGFNCVFGGDIPIGAGLSSSAAIEAGLTYAVNHIFNLQIDKLSLVRLAQKAENEFVGVKCGIMDQFINIFGESRNALRIDCRSLEYELVPFDYENISVVFFNTNVSHSLASSEYNLRREECSKGVAVIKKEFPVVNSLRDANAEMLESCKLKMEPLTYRRCKYVVEENERLLKACEALKVHDLTAFGSLLYETHVGLSRDYEVSCPELDFLVDAVKEFPAVYGARMMGGGFGGCTINIIENESVEMVTSLISKKYKERFNREATVYVTKISAGTGIVSAEEHAAV